MANEKKAAEARRWNADHAKIEVEEIENMEEVVGYFQKKADDLRAYIKREVWDFGEDAECVKKDRAILAHYEAVASKIKGVDGKLLGAVYELSADKLMGLAVKVKERPDWCENNIPDFPQVRAALEKVLDIREDDRERVYRYYHSTSRYPKVQSGRQLRQAYEFQRMMRREDDVRFSDSLAISLKRAIREYTNRPSGGVWIVKDGGADGYTELREMPRFDSPEEADEWFRRYYLEARPSAYDCTGQRFTVWYKLFQRRGRWWAYHCVGVDV